MPYQDKISDSAKLTCMSNHKSHFPSHSRKSQSDLNRLRAAVLGANDGIVSVAGIVVGVASATDAAGVILTAGVAGVVAGVVSMALGEYVSVSSQRDTESALLDNERAMLQQHPKEELAELAQLYRAKGLSEETAQTVARELTAHDGYAAHVDAELKIDPEDLANPWQAATASAAAFFGGAIIPLVAILIPPTSLRVGVTFAAVLVALTITGVISARVGGAKVGRATGRVVLGGALAMAVTYGVGTFIKTFGI